MKYGYLSLLSKKYEIFHSFVTHPKLNVEPLCFVYYYRLKILSKDIQLLGHIWGTLDQYHQPKSTLLSIFYGTVFIILCNPY